MDRKKYKKLKYLIILLFIISGSSISILLKNLTVKKFYFPFFQVFIMFVGEFMSVLIYLFEAIRLKKNRDVNNLRSFVEKVHVYKKILIFSFVSILDFINAFLEDYCINHMNVSDFLSLKMTVNYYILLYRSLIIKRKIFRHQLLGLLIFSIGIFLFVINNTWTANSSERKQYGVYIGLMLAAELVMSTQLLLIEYFAWKYNSAASEIVSIRSTSGLVLCAILYIPITYLFPGQYTSLSTPFQLLYSDKFISIIITSLIFLIGIYNYLQVFLLKVTESLAVCTLDSGRIVIISVVFAFFVINKWIGLQIVAAFCIFIGLIIYNEILVLPFCGFKQSAVSSLKENKMIRRKREEERMWIHKLVFFTETQNKASDFTLNV